MFEQAAQSYWRDTVFTLSNLRAEDWLARPEVLTLEVLERAQKVRIPFKDGEVAWLSKDDGDWICKIVPLVGETGLGMQFSVDVDWETRASGKPVMREERLRQQLESLVDHVRCWHGCVASHQAVVCAKKLNERS